MKTKYIKGSAGAETLAVFITILVVALLATSFGTAVGVAKIRNQAIQARVAHWTIDPKTGVKSFEFISITNRIYDPN